MLPAMHPDEAECQVTVNGISVFGIRYSMNNKELTLHYEYFGVHNWFTIRLFSPIYFDDSILIDVFKDVWCVHEDANGTGGCHDKEHVQL